MTASSRFLPIATAAAVVLAIASCAVAASSARAAGGFSFVDWTGASAGVVHGTLQGSPVSMTGPTATNYFDGSWQGFDADYWVPRLATWDDIELRTSEGSTFTFSFGTPVTDPLIHLASVASELVFPAGTVITKLSGQPTLVVSGNTVSGTVKPADAHGDTDSNGTIRLRGTYTSLTFTGRPTFVGGENADGVSVALAVATAGPQTLISLDPAEPGPSGAYAGSVTAHVGAIDGISGGSVETRCALDPPAVPASFGDLPASCPFLMPGGVTAPGTHVLYAASRDFYGNEDGPVSRAFTIAASLDTTITQGPEGEVWETSPLFAFAATVPGSTFECSVDGGPWVACATPWRTGALTSAGHDVAVRAVAPDGTRDATPARRAFSVGAPSFRRMECRVQPVYFRVFTLDWSHEDRLACEIRTPGDTSACPATNVCTYTHDSCPAGARCTLITRGAWYDADEKMNWGITAASVQDPKRRLWGDGLMSVVLSSGHAAAQEWCQTGFDGDRCYASASISAIGDGTPLWSGCATGLFAGSGMLGFSRPHYDSIRRIECTAELQIEPVRPLTMTAAVQQTRAAMQQAQIYLSTAGSLTIKAQITALRDRFASAAARRPTRIAPVRVNVRGSGLVKIPLKLNKAARKALARRERLAVRLRARFTPAGGTPQTRTTRVTLRRAATAPRTCNLPRLRQPKKPLNCAFPRKPR